MMDYLLKVRIGTRLRKAIALVVVGLGSLAAAPTTRLTLPAAEVDRAGVVVTFTLPGEAPPSPVLRDAAGRSLAVQVDAERRARFVVPEVKAGTAPTFLLESAADSVSPAVVRVATERNRLHLTIAGAPVLDYQMDKEALPRADIDSKFKRAGYLHPIFTPAGVGVTDDYPANHIHHHGLWTAWSKTQFQGRAPNFWEMAEQTGTVEFVAVDRTWSGPVHGGFVTRQRFVDLSASPPRAALDETWELTAFAAGSANIAVRMFDLTITQACATSDPLLLPKLHYGGLGFRGRGDWDGKERLAVLTPEGETERNKANGTRVRWCYLGSATRPAAGAVILGHPENFRAPQPIRVHPDMPFLCFAPSHLGDWAIEPGKPYVARYRILAVDGPPDRAQIEAFWNGYAHAPGVQVESR